MERKNTTKVRIQNKKLTQESTTIQHRIKEYELYIAESEKESFSYLRGNEYAQQVHREKHAASEEIPQSVFLAHMLT